MTFFDEQKDHFEKSLEHLKDPYLKALIKQIKDNNINIFELFNNDLDKILAIKELLELTKEEENKDKFQSLIDEEEVQTLNKVSKGFMDKLSRLDPLIIQLLQDHVDVGILLIEQKRDQIMNQGGADLNVKEAIIMARDIGITKNELVRLKSLTPDDITNLESAINKFNEYEKNQVEHNKEEEELKKEEKIKKLDQVDDESKEILEKEAMSRISQEDLKLLMSIDKNVLEILKRIDHKYLELIANN